MKLYNKKGFFHGLTFCACGSMNLVLLTIRWFRTFRWFWYLDTAAFFLIGGVLLIRALSQEKSQQDLMEKWNIGEIVIYNKYGFLDGFFFLLCATGSLVSALSLDLGWHQYFYTFLFVYFGLNWIVRSMSLEEAKKDIIEERDERNKLVVLKTHAMSFQITQTASLLLMCFFVLKGGKFNQLDLASAGVGAALCFFISVLAGFFTRKYYEKHL